MARERGGNGGLGLFLALGLIMSTWIAANAVRDVRMSNQIIKVRGYAEKAVKSDVAEWTVTVDAREKTGEEAYASLKSQASQVVSFLRESGVAEDRISLSPARVEENRRLVHSPEQKEQGRPQEPPVELVDYTASQAVTVKTQDVDRIEKIVPQISALYEKGLSLNIGNPRYFYSKINELKSELLTAATRDAKQRATTLAEGSGVGLGALRAARQGEFSILSADRTTLDTEYAADNEDSVQKKVAAVVTVDYAMK
ncbi:MAG: SIMPL domain-containing protein [Thermodesulfobacteriota bacterium]